MQNDPRSTSLLLALALVAPSLIGAPALGASEDEPGSAESVAREQRPTGPEASAHPPVEVGLSGALFVAEPQVSGVATSVYVSCSDGAYLHREFEGVGAAVVELAWKSGVPVADGRCKYEVYVHPPVDREAMRAAEKKRDLEALERLSRIEREQTVIVSGVFWIAGGSAVSNWPGDPSE